MILKNRLFSEWIIYVIFICLGIISFLVSLRFFLNTYCCYYSKIIISGLLILYVSVTIFYLISLSNTTTLKKTLYHIYRFRNLKFYLAIILLFIWALLLNISINSVGCLVENNNLKHSGTVVNKNYITNNNDVESELNSIPEHSSKNDLINTTNYHYNIYNIRKDSVIKNDSILINTLYNELLHIKQELKNIKKDTIYNIDFFNIHLNKLKIKNNLMQRPDTLNYILNNKNLNLEAGKIKIRNNIF